MFLITSLLVLAQLWLVRRWRFGAAV